MGLCIITYLSNHAPHLREEMWLMYSVFNFGFIFLNIKELFNTFQRIHSIGWDFSGVLICLSLDVGTDRTPYNLRRRGKERVMGGEGEGEGENQQSPLLRSSYYSSDDFDSPKRTGNFLSYYYSDSKRLHFFNFSFWRLWRDQLLIFGVFVNVVMWI